MDVGERQDWLVGVTYLVVGVWRRTVDSPLVLLKTSPVHYRGVTTGVALFSTKTC